MDDTLIEEGKRLSFFQLFKTLDYKIEIPIIQRDYAQGRKSKKEVRDLFLEALFDYLKENIPFRDLDFVYGSTETEGGLEKFIPLDGQQRLTTLFLLHWYMANISGNIDSFKALMLDKTNSKFTYLTRSSSSEFCDALLNNGIDFSNLLVDERTKIESIATTIKDSGWYFLSWSKDPTIQSMLIMLDAINEKFKFRPDFYDRLIDENKPTITFLYLDLGKYKLTEDLYIKMNSRGKPLTSFENFKAKFEQHIEKVFVDDEIKYLLPGREVKIKEYFSFNIDTKWANLFWQYRELVGNKSTFDEEIMNFICIVASNQFAIENSSLKIIYPSILKKEVLDGVEIPISFYKLEKFGALTKGLINYLINSLERLTNGNNKIKTYLDNKFYYDEEEIFKSALKNGLTRVGRIQFHAYLRFLIIHDNKTEGLYQWMRFVHNITENTEIDDTDKEISAFLEIENLLKNCSNITDFQIKNEIKTSAFFDRQLQEERLKFFLIKKSDEWKLSIEKYECTNHFKGQILFLLEFSGVLEFFTNNNNCDWTDAENSNFIQLFNDYGQKAIVFFDCILKPINSEFILERAVLTKGDYLIPAAQNRYNFLSSNKVNNYLRDYSWRALLRFPIFSDDEEDAIYWEEKRALLKELFDDKNYDYSDIAKSLKKIIKDTPTDWRKYFVQNPKLIGYCGQGFIRFKNENDITLLLNMSENSKMREMFTYNLFTNLDNEDINKSPFKNLHHQEINREFDISFLKYVNWCYKKIEYNLIVSHGHNVDEGHGFFKIKFRKGKGIKEFDNYNQDIIDILTENKFKWDDERKEFYRKKRSEEATLDFINKLRIQFNSIINE